MIRDYHYTIHKEGSQTIQRQTFEHTGTVIISENPPAHVADVAAMTQWGNYCCHFDDCGDICKLLRSADDYLMDRFLGGHAEGSVLDIKATVKAIAEQLCTTVVRDDYGYPNHDQRLREQRLTDLYACETERELNKWAEVWEMEGKMPLVYGYSEDARKFLHHGLPMIRESAMELRRMKAGFVD